MTQPVFHRAPRARFLGVLIVSALALPLGGCFGASSTIVLEDKLPTDYVAEAVTGMDCNYIRHIEDKGPLCRPERREVIEQPLYCYRTLAAVECYEERDPYGIGQRTVN
jgi:hypothetical protein